LLTVPPYAAAAILTITIGYIADRTHQRGLCNIAVSILGMIGFSMLLAGTTPGVRYAGTFLGGMCSPTHLSISIQALAVNPIPRASTTPLLPQIKTHTNTPIPQPALGIYPCIANTIVWISNNTEGVYKRGITMGFVIGWGNLNGVVSSNIYQAKDAPKYRKGHGIVLAYLTIFLFGGSILQYVLLRNENRKRRAGRRDYWAEGKTEKEIEAMGDTRPDFIYHL